MGYTPKQVWFNTNLHVIGAKSGHVMLRESYKNDPSLYAPYNTYDELYIYRTAQFWKVPKKSKNVRFEIPFWRATKDTWSDEFQRQAETISGRTGTALTSWLKDMDNNWAVAEATATALHVQPPNKHILYTMVDSLSLGDKEIWSHCFNCAVSLQVFTTSGKLLAGTPLRNWNVCKGEYWGASQGYVGAPASYYANRLQGADAPVDAAGERLWRTNGIWPAWYSLVSTYQNGVDYWDWPTPSGFIPTKGSILSPAMLVSKLQEIYPTIFSSSFNFDDSEVNGDGLELLKNSESFMKTITVDGETIKWSGCNSGATGTFSTLRMDELGNYPLTRHGTSTTPFRSSPAQTLTIDYTNQDLIIGMVGSDDCGVYGEWEEYYKEIRDPGIPLTLRYHPTHNYVFPYQAGPVTTTDRMHKRNALYFPIRDHVGCIEVRQMGDGVDNGGKRIYIDHTYWYNKFPSDVKCMDLSFGYDYQRLYVLFKQVVNNNFRAWVSMYDVNLPDGTITDSKVSIPLYGFLTDYVHTHPFAPTDMESILDYMEECGLTGELIDKLPLEPAFNILSVYDRLFVTMPMMFKSISTPWDKEIALWTPSDARMLCQLMYMFDESTSRIRSISVIGGVSPWKESWQTPRPDIEPKRPFKLRMGLIDENIYWMLAHVRTFPENWYTDDETRDHYPDQFYLKSSWDYSDIPDRFWQPMTTEAIYVDDLIKRLSDTDLMSLRPTRHRPCPMYYVETPLTSGISFKSEPTWEGQRVFSTQHHHLQEYRVVYHNFKRKILLGVGEKQGTQLVKISVPKQTFQPLREWQGDPRSLTYAQYTTLRAGHYRAYLRGADGGPAIDNETGTAYGSGGQGASVVVEFDLAKETEFTVYVGAAGMSNQAGWPQGGIGGALIKEEEASVWNTIRDIRDVLTQSVEQTFTVPVAGYAFFMKVPKGAKNVHLYITRSCPAHNASFQVMHMDGTLLTGTRTENNANNLWSWYVGKSSPSSEDVTDKLKEAYPAVFDKPSFEFDDSNVNGQTSGQEFKSATLKTFNVDGETIQWTGNSKGGTAENGLSKDVEELFIEEAKEDLAVGVLSTHFFTLLATWDMEGGGGTPSPFASILGGGGGGLTGLFIENTPIAIAGSGGGGGLPSADVTATLQEVTGGHGGNISGKAGTLHGEEITKGGTQSSGYMKFQGEPVYTTSSAAGGGGAGYYGGTARQAEGTEQPGGGGGSSFVLGGLGYGSERALDELTITSYEVTSGSTPPYNNTEQGLVTIEGYYTQRGSSSTDYQFIDHDLGDFYYQCASPVIIDHTSTSTAAKLNVVILCDITGSMWTYIDTLSGAIPALVAGVSGGDYEEVQYAVVSYSDSRYWIECGDGGSSFTQDESLITSRMQEAVDRCKTTGGGLETWANAIVGSYNDFQSELIGNNTMYVIITDEVNMDDNDNDRADATNILNTINGTLIWVVPEQYNETYTPEYIANLTNDTNGTFIKGMNPSNSDWGGDVATAIAESAPEPIVVDEDTLGAAHIFSIENLSCHTSMKDVHLRSTLDGFKLGHVPDCDPTRPFGLPKTLPDQSELVWDEIAPQEEVLFMVLFQLEPPDTGVSAFNGHTYKVYDTAMSWQAAKADCEARGGHLATITSQEEQNFINSLLTLPAGSTYWTGGVKTDGVWGWCNDETWSYTNWSPGEPNNSGGNEPYVHLYSNGRWNDEKESYQATAYICEWDWVAFESSADACNSLHEGLRFSYYLESYHEEE